MTRLLHWFQNGIGEALFAWSAGTPNLDLVGRAGHGRHGGEASALCVRPDDVGLDSSVPFHQGEGTRKPQP